MLATSEPDFGSESAKAAIASPARVFASQRWAALAVPVPDRRHGLFYQHILTVLGLGDGATLRSMRIFDPLPRDIQEQARWGRLLSDPEWGSPPPAATSSRIIRFIDITDDYEKSISNLVRVPG